MRLLIIFLLLISCYAIVPLPASGNYTTKLEQQINLIDQEYSTTSLTSAPTDNSLGLIKWEGDLYDGETVYFEALIYCNSCSGGNNQATATLYSSGGSAVTGAVVSTSNSSYVRVRSSSITANLSNNTLYTVRLTKDVDNGTAYLKAARLIVLQDNSNLTDTLTHIEVGDAGSFTNTARDLMPGGVKIFRYEPGVFDPLNAVYFEATLKNSGVSDVTYAALSSAGDCSTVVDNSEVNVSGNSWSLSRSGDIKAYLSANTNYWVCVKTSTGTGSIANAKLIIYQSSAQGLMKTQTYHLYNNTQSYDSDSTYSGLQFFNEFNPANFSADNVSYFLESSLSTTDGTGYARLTNATDTTPLTSTEINVDTFGLVRTRSSNRINSYLPSSTKNLDLELKNSNTYTTGSTVSWLITFIERYPDPSASFTFTGVNSGETHNGVTTSVTSQVAALPFGTLIPGSPKYAAHLLSASSNGSPGYSVTTKLVNYLQGNDAANNIDAFPGLWATPITWYSPNSSTPNNNTGWLGANTSDTRVPGWSGSSAKFGGLQYNNDYLVMFSSGVDSGTTAYVSYALEVNIFQPPDGYSGTIRYNFLPTY